MIPFSLLDLAPIPEGATARDALSATLELARRAEEMGISTLLVAEHHNMPGIASALPPSSSVGAAVSNTIRVGAGGIMLPNHSPLMVAEAFGTLATLYPGRIELGLGGPPGLTWRRPGRCAGIRGQADTFPEDVVELIGYFADEASGPVRAIPAPGPTFQSGFLAPASSALNSRLIWGCPTSSLRTSRRANSRRRFLFMEHFPAVRASVESARHACDECLRRRD